LEWAYPEYEAKDEGKVKEVEVSWCRFTPKTELNAIGPSKFSSTAEPMTSLTRARPKSGVKRCSLHWQQSAGQAAERGPQPDLHFYLSQRKRRLGRKAGSFYFVRATAAGVPALTIQERLAKKEM
jgi:hypothetical protein